MTFILKYVTRESARAAAAFSAIYCLPLLALSVGPFDSYLSVLLIPPLIWLSVVDLSARIVPDVATLCVAAIGVVGLFWRAPEAWLLTILVAAGFALVLALAGKLYWKKHGEEALGLGDVKLIGAGVLVVGLDGMWVMLFLASLGGIIASMLHVGSEKKGIPFGPYIAYAMFVTTLMMGSQP